MEKWVKDRRNTGSSSGGFHEFRSAWRKREGKNERGGPENYKESKIRGTKISNPEWAKGPLPRERREKRDYLGLGGGVLNRLEMKPLYKVPAHSARRGGGEKGRKNVSKKTIKDGNYRAPGQPVGEKRNHTGAWRKGRVAGVRRKGGQIPRNSVEGPNRRVC